VERAGLTTRIFLAVMAGALVALILGVAWYGLSESLLATVNPGLLALAAVILAVVAAAIVTVILGGSIIDESRSMLSLAQRGRADGADEAGAAHERLASMLEERNRQVSDLAARGVSAPIDQDARRVAAYVVDTARTVSGDPTWLLAVLVCEFADLLPPGVYDADRETQPADVTDLHRWASVATAQAGAAACRLDGRWGAFVGVSIVVPGRMSALLFAPWEGRAEPSAAELDLLALVGQHAAIALDHALLFARVRAQASELDRLAGVQSDFLRGVTHDLQTPLTSIRAVASELRGRAGNDLDARNDLEVIVHQAERLRRMVSQLLIVSRLEAGPIQPRIEVLRVRPLVERTWGALRPPMHRLEIIEQGPDSLAMADPDRLEQVLWALLDNAVKYSPAGSTIEIRIEAGRAEPAHIIVRIRDAGIGMDAATQSHAFEQFFRSDEARRLVPDGSGVGLYAVKGLVEAMGGTVSATSRIGQGTEIGLRLPAELVGSDEQDLGTGVVAGHTL